MTRAEEWDWPPTRRRRYRRTVDADRTVPGMPVAARPDFEFTRLGNFERPLCYQRGGWNSPITKKIVNIYWLTTITIIKMLLAIPLSIMAIGAFWLFWTIIIVAVSH